MKTYTFEWEHCADYHTAHTPIGKFMVIDGLGERPCLWYPNGKWREYDTLSDAKASAEAYYGKVKQ